MYTFEEKKNSKILLIVYYFVYLHSNLRFISLTKNL